VVNQIHSLLVTLDLALLKMVLETFSKSLVKLRMSELQWETMVDPKVLPILNLRAVNLLRMLLDSMVQTSTEEH